MFNGDLVEVLGLDNMLVGADVSLVSVISRTRKRSAHARDGHPKHNEAWLIILSTFRRTTACN